VFDKPKLLGYFVPKVFKQVSGGISIAVLTRDEHCPPHVHVMHQGEGWEIKVHFSFAEHGQGTYWVEPVAHSGMPSISRVNAVINRIARGRRECRTKWWKYLATVCLSNQWLEVDAAGVVRLAAPNLPNAAVVSAAAYEAATDEVSFVTTTRQARRGKCP
jgi:hypothetical protein